MRPLVLFLLLAGVAHPAQAADCSSFVRSVCAKQIDETAPGAKTLTARPRVKTPSPDGLGFGEDIPSSVLYVVGDRFPVEERSLLMDPTRYGLAPSDGTWRYYAISGVVYRVENGTGLVLEVIRDRRTSHLR